MAAVTLEQLVVLFKREKLNASVEAHHMASTE